MNFTSTEFLFLFLPGVIAGFLLLRTANFRQLFLVAASLAFYSLSGAQNALVLLGSIAINGTAGRLLTTLPIEGDRKGRLALLWLGIIANVGCLLIFKVLALKTSSGEGFRTAEDILIPLALSYVTFQQIGFVYSCYKGETRNFSVQHYLFFILFFPQLVMGPIVRFQNISRQLDRKVLGSFELENLAIGLGIFGFGLAKKVLLADNLFVTVDRVFLATQAGPVATLDMWYAVVGFQMQLFLDFTAYADMAIGLARIFGVNLPINFDRSLYARDRVDVWRRWHITFALFMRKHVFMPLIRVVKLPIPIALTITGFLSGIWHGLGWTFVLWGVLQTSLMLASHYRKKIYRRPPTDRGPRVVLAVATTFFITCLIGAVFRTPDFQQLGNVFTSLLTATEDPSLLGPRAWPMLAGITVFCWGWPETHRFFHRYWTATDLRPRAMQPSGYAQKSWVEFRLTPAWGLISGLMLIACILFIERSGRFIYVQF